MIVAILLIALVVGALGGWALDRHRVAEWLTIGTVAATGIGAALGAWVAIPGIPSTGGTMPHHMLPERIDELLALSSFVLILLTPLVLGFVIGSINSFTRDDRGGLHFGLCVGACVPGIVVGFFLLWLVAF